MKKECDIVQDLLFGYTDKTLKQGSKEFVEAHLEKCEDCKKVLKEIQADEKTNIEDNYQEVDYLKKINRKINKKSIIITITSVLLVILVIFNIAVYVNYKNFAEEMEIFFVDEATEEQIAAVKTAILSIDSEAEIKYKTKKEALEQMKENFGDKAHLLEGYEKDNVFPNSYEVKAKLNKIQEIKDKVETMPGVRTISSIIGTNPYAAFFFMKIHNIQNE